MGNEMEQDRDKRIEDLLASYGANRARWPQALEGSAPAAAEADARAIDRVLAQASMPELPVGAMDRLMAKLDDAAPAPESNVVLFRPAVQGPRRRIWRYAAALPLAASLALGLYLGSRGTLDTLLPHRHHGQRGPERRCAGRPRRDRRHRGLCRGKHLMTANRHRSRPARAPAPPRQPDAHRSSRWIKIALVASLAVNLLFVGGGIARFAMHGGPPERFANSSQMQLIPRRFLGDVGGERRRELLAIFKTYGPSFKEGRKTRPRPGDGADALDAGPYDPARTKAAIAQFGSASATLMETGGNAAEEMIGKLTPDERKLLAQHIRMRDQSGGRMRKMDDGPGGD